MKDFKGVALYAAGGFTAIATMFIIQGAQAYQTTPEAQVLRACNDSRLVNDGAKEELCGTLQDKFKLEFLCDGLEAESQCWTEKNNQLGN